MYTDNEIYLTFDTDYLEEVCSAVVEYENEKLTPLVRRWEELQKEYNKSKHWFWGYDKGNLIYDEMRDLESKSRYLFGGVVTYYQTPLSAMSDLCLHRSYATSVLHLVEKYEEVRQVHLPSYKVRNIFYVYDKIKED